jgi:hypothetical protein
MWDDYCPALPTGSQFPNSNSFTAIKRPAKSCKERAMLALSL